MAGQTTTGLLLPDVYTGGLWFFTCLFLSCIIFLIQEDNFPIGVIGRIGDWLHWLFIKKTALDELEDSLAQQATPPSTLPGSHTVHPTYAEHMSSLWPGLNPSAASLPAAPEMLAYIVSESLVKTEASRIGQPEIPCAAVSCPLRHTQKGTCSNPSRIFLDSSFRCQTGIELTTTPEGRRPPKRIIQVEEENP